MVIKEIFINNGYPEEVIDDNIKLIVTRFKNKNTIFWPPKCSVYFRLPWVGPVSQSFAEKVASSVYYCYHAVNVCREEENLIFCFGALFNSTLNFTQSGWHIPFSPDLHFRLAKRVSSQNHSLRLVTATRTDVSLVVPA